MTTTIDTEKLERVAFILKTIAHPLRIGVIDLLTQADQMSVNEICDSLEAEQSLMSHHLNNMKLKGILSSRRDGKHIYYSLAMKEVVDVIHCMRNCAIVVN